MGFDNSRVAAFISPSLVRLNPRIDCANINEKNVIAAIAHVRQKEKDKMVTLLSSIRTFRRSDVR